MENCVMQIDGFYDLSTILRSGVYILCWKEKVVYVGQSKKMLGRIYTHANMYLRSRKDYLIARFIPVKGIRFDAVHVRPCQIDELDLLEREMIKRYDPVHNIHHKPKTQKEFPIRIMGVEYIMNGTLKQVEKPSIGVLRRI